MDSLGAALILGGLFTVGAAVTGNATKVVTVVTKAATTPNTYYIFILLTVLTVIHQQLANKTAKSAVKSFGLLILLSGIYQNAFLIKDTQTNE